MRRYATVTSMPNVKLLPGLLDSDFWQAANQTCRVVWLTMMCMADDDGIVRAGVLGISARCCIAYDSVMESIGYLCCDAGMAQVVDGGWKMLNHEGLVAFQTRKQEAGAERAARYRAKRAKGSK